MRAFHYSAISIPVILALLSATPSAVSASPVGLDMTTFEVISGGHAAESKCRNLTDGEREELATHAAFAETAAVRKNGSAQVMVARKRASGKVACGPDARKRAKAGLKAGRMFEQHFVDKTRARQKTRGKKKRRQARAQTRSKPRRQIAVLNTRVTTDRTRRAGSGTLLNRFGTQTAAYYIQRRCTVLNYSDDLNFWKMITRQHKRLVRRYGAGPVGRLQRRAKTVAAHSGCGHGARQMVIAGLHAISSDLRR